MSAASASSRAAAFTRPCALLPSGLRWNAATVMQHALLAGPLSAAPPTDASSVGLISWLPSSSRASAPAFARAAGSSCM